jgi:hypothetical protein
MDIKQKVPWYYAAAAAANIATIYSRMFDKHFYKLSLKENNF